MVMNTGLKLFTLDEKLAYLVFKTKSSNVNQIVLLPTGDTCKKKLLNIMKTSTKIGNLHNGKINGVSVTILRAGIGSSHVAMVMEALKRSNCRIAIRIDYCGGLQTMDHTLDIADVIIPEKVFLTDGTAHSYLQTYSHILDTLPIESKLVKTGDLQKLMLYPSYENAYWAIQVNQKLYQGLWDCLQGLNYEFKIKSGILWSVDALFCETESAIRTWLTYGANSVDMESSAVYFLGQLFNIPTISILGISDLPDSKQWNFQRTNYIHPKYEFILDNAIEVLTLALPEINEKVISHESS